MATSPFGVARSIPPPAKQYDGRSGTETPWQRVFFGAAPVDAVSMEEATQWLVRGLQERRLDPSRKPLQVMGPNAFLVTLAATNRYFAQALRQASMCLPDGMSVVWGARLLGTRIPERVPGGEFMERMCQACAANGFSIYLLGGLPGAAEGAAKRLQERYPGLEVSGTDCPPLGFEQHEKGNEQVCKRIAKARPDLLCVALGAPKQEIWMLDECGNLPVGAALSVGAAFDTQAGLRKRAPAWTHNIGAEWLYRLLMEPRRLWKRYLIGNLHFAAITAQEWVRMRKAAAMDKLLHTDISGTHDQRTADHAPRRPDLLHSRAHATQSRMDQASDSTRN